MRTMVPVRSSEEFLVMQKSGHFGNGLHRLSKASSPLLSKVLLPSAAFRRIRGDFYGATYRRLCHVPIEGLRTTRPPVCRAGALPGAAGALYHLLRLTSHAGDDHTSGARGNAVLPQCREPSAASGGDFERRR